ncbi:MAG: GtrA family protein [Shinella sp.]|jgi:putative flippase GtrA|nr:GtrA family protein [Shinella sp.]
MERVAAISPRFTRFAVIGSLGFLFEAIGIALLSSTGLLGAGTARLVTFPLAVVLTWLLNRSWTFRSTDKRRIQQLLTYGGVQAAGGLANLGVYLLVLRLTQGMPHNFFPALCAGSAAGLLLTFAGSKTLCFRT